MNMEEAKERNESPADLKQKATQEQKEKKKLVE
jgi:hypothetical protein